MMLIKKLHTSKFRVQLREIFSIDATYYALLYIHAIYVNAP